MISVGITELNFFLEGIMLRRSFNLIFLFLITLLFSISSARAVTLEQQRKQTYFYSGSWQGGANLNKKKNKFTSCYITKKFANKTHLILYFRKKTIGFVLVNSDWMLQRGITYPAEVKVYNKDIEFTQFVRLKPFTVGISKNWAVGFSLPRSPRLIRYLSEGRRLDLVGQTSTQKFDLAGTGSAISKVEFCYEKWVRAKAESTNPFETSPSANPFLPQNRDTLRKKSSPKLEYLLEIGKVQRTYVAYLEVIKKINKVMELSEAVLNKKIEQGYAQTNIYSELLRIKNSANLAEKAFQKLKISLSPPNRQYSKTIQFITAVKKISEKLAIQSITASKAALSGDRKEFLGYQRALSVAQLLLLKAENAITILEFSKQKYTPNKLLTGSIIIGNEALIVLTEVGLGKIKRERALEKLDGLEKTLRKGTQKLDSVIIRLGNKRVAKLYREAFAIEKQINVLILGLIKNIREKDMLQQPAAWKMYWALFQTKLSVLINKRLNERRKFRRVAMEKLAK